MAILEPDFENISRLKVKPTEGEMYLLRVLTAQLDDSYRVFFQPFLNGDMPDIIVARENCGVTIIEVKDWNLSAYSVSTKNSWKENSSGARIKSPFEQVFKYKANMFDIHINGLAEYKVHNPNFWNVINVFVFFYGSEPEDLTSIYTNAELELKNEVDDNNSKFYKKGITWSKYENKQKYLDRKVAQIRRDKRLALTQPKLPKIADSLKKPHVLFTSRIYDEICRYLQPPTHVLEQGIEILYTPSQSKYIESEKGFQKVKGPAGTGKTVVLARRAVNAHKRHGERVLVLTFNKTLRNYIHDRISDVREYFSWGYFCINNYHNLMSICLNQAGISIEVPEGISPREFSEYIDRHYYSNESIFVGKEDEVYKYKSIFIDEIQDYKPEWIKIIRRYFLCEDGEMVLFGDDGQNIYERDSEVNGQALLQGFGRWGRMSEVLRQKAGSPIIDLSKKFQKTFLGGTGDSVNQDDSPKQFEADIGVFKYVDYDQNDLGLVVDAMLREIRLLTISPNDVCVITSSIQLAREVEYEIRQKFREKTDTTFEDKETYLKLLERYKPPSSFELSRDLDSIRGSKKFAFHSNSGKVKVSTVHSFKGLEAPTLFYLLDEKDSNEIVYTAITRAKYNIMVFLPRESKYNQFFSRELSAGTATWATTSDLPSSEGQSYVFGKLNG